MENGGDIEKIDKEKIGQEQIHGLLFGDKLSWQAIIYDLINSEQLDPWDIDICLLANRYLEKVKELEEANFFVSSKVLLAASLLLRLKSEILLNHYIPGLDEILFGKKEEKHYVQEKIELDDEIPELIPRTPLPRGRRVTLEELMSALGKAIKTEARRIKRVVIERQREMDAMVVIPKSKIDIKKQINSLYDKLEEISLNNNGGRIAYSHITGKNNKEKIDNFLPLLHLDNQHKVLAEQENHFDEIWIWLKSVYQEKHAEALDNARREVEEFLRQEAEKISREDRKKVNN